MQTHLQSPKPQWQWQRQRQLQRQQSLLLRPRWLRLQQLYSEHHLRQMKPRISTKKAQTRVLTSTDSQTHARVDVARVHSFGDSSHPMHLHLELGPQVH